MRGRKEKTATKEQPHNATQCHLQMNGCIILTTCHVPCIHSCEGENNMRGKKERTATKEQPHNATQCHLQMNGCIILTPCHVPCIHSCEGRTT